MNGKPPKKSILRNSIQRINNHTLETVCERDASEVAFTSSNRSSETINSTDLSTGLRSSSITFGPDEIHEFELDEYGVYEAGSKRKSEKWVGRLALPTTAIFLGVMCMKKRR